MGHGESLQFKISRASAAIEMDQNGVHETYGAARGNPNRAVGCRHAEIEDPMNHSAGRSQTRDRLEDREGSSRRRQMHVFDSGRAVLDGVTHQCNQTSPMLHILHRFSPLARRLADHRKLSIHLRMMRQCEMTDPRNHRDRIDSAHGGAGDRHQCIAQQV